MKEMDNGALKIGELPELHMVDLDDVILHEDPDNERVERLLERFRSEGELRNPPVVARVDGDSNRIVLDGANRMTALKKLGLSHVMVQEIDLLGKGLNLSCWHHAIEHIGRKELLRHARSIPGIAVEDGGDFNPKSPFSLCSLTFDDGGTALLKGAAGLLERVGQLRRFTGLYHRFTHFDRVSYTDLNHLRQNYRDFRALASFHEFTKEDLVILADRGSRLPSGITRVLLPKRALRFNLRLEILGSNTSLEEKEDWLQATILEKVAAKSIRFYSEPTFFFDE